MIGTGQHYLILNRVKAKLYVSKTYRLRDLIMELYIPPSSKGRAGRYVLNRSTDRPLYDLKQKI